MNSKNFKTFYKNTQWHKKAGKNIKMVQSLFIKQAIS